MNKNLFLLLTVAVSAALSIPTFFVADKNVWILGVLFLSSILVMSILLYLDNKVGDIFRDWSPEVFMLAGALIWLTQLGVNMVILYPLTLIAFFGLAFIYRSQSYFRPQESN